MLIDARPGRPDHVYLSDFGLAKTSSSSVLTQAGLYLGTVAYMAPEQIEGRDVDGRTDQYALACAAFELLAGVVPFEREQDMAVIYAHLSAPPPSLAARCPGVPAAADEVLARAMAKAPADRYPSCREFTEALRRAFGLPAYDGHPGASGPGPPDVTGTPAAAVPAAEATRPGPGGGDRGARELPAGIVTLLFSDIEGSAVLLGRLGERYGEALSAQRAIVRAAIGDSRGVELGAEGDSFSAVFRSAADAVRCCVAAQRSLAAYDWPGGVAVRVRMGLHAGEPSRHEDGYIGMDVHRAALLAAAPRLVVLATSRRPLHLQAEHELPVPPLQPPGEAGVEEVAANAAARLFVQQAGMVKPGFAVTRDNAADVASICRRLDGLPLAIELAASRVKLLAPRAILARLGHSPSLGSAELERPSRQQTLRNTIAWSYDLLDPDLAAVFRRAGVFAGGCDLPALAAVTLAGRSDPAGSGPAGSDPLDLAAALLDVSLITITEGEAGEPRIAMLETIREYALERLTQAGEDEQTRHRHAEHYAAFAERAIQHVDGPGHLVWLDRLEAEHDNLRAALRWSLETRAGEGERAAIGLRLVQALGPFWYRHGHAPEGRRWLERAIDLAPDDAGAPLARLAHWLGVLLQQQGELEAALRLLERSLAIWRELGDRDQQARELNSLGITHRYLGHLDTARSFLEDSAAIAREIGSDARLAAALTNLGHLEREAGHMERAVQVLQEALTLDQKQGDTWGAVIDQQSLALVLLLAGRIPQASEMLAATLDYVASAGDTSTLTSAIELAACIAAELGDGPRAARLTGAAEAIRQQAGTPIPQPDAALLETFLAPVRATTQPGVWDTELAAGRALTYEQTLALLRACLPSLPPALLPDQ